MTPEFRAGERVSKDPRLTCCECGGVAEGEISVGSEWICNRCDRKMMIADARFLAAKLRKGEILSYLDSIIGFKDGRFSETSMGYDGEGHYFGVTHPSWLKIRHFLRNGNYH